MRRLPHALLCIALTSAPAAAQPGYTDPISMAQVRELETLSAATQEPGTLHSRIDRLERLAVALHALTRSSDADPARVDRAALSRFRSAFGRPITDAGAMGDEVYERCRALVRSAHGYSAAARRCVGQRTTYPHEASELVALPAPAGFLQAATADAASAFYASVAERHGRAPGPSTRRDLAGMQLATGDHAAVHRTLAGARDYDAAVTAAVASLRAGRSMEAARELAAALLREPTRPEAAYDLAIMWAGELAATEGLASRATYRAQLVFGRAALCTLTAAGLPMPPEARERVGRVAEAGQWLGHGQSHWTWRTGAARPPPFLPWSELPASLQDPAGGPASMQCPEAAAVAATVARAMLRDGVVPAVDALPRGP